MEALAAEQKRMASGSTLSGIVQQTQDVIDCLERARDEVAAGIGRLADEAKASRSLDHESDVLKTGKPVEKQAVEAQSVIRKSFDAANSTLKDIYKSQSRYQKALDSKFKEQPLPSAENDALSSQCGLIDRAIAMHLLREGEFDVAAQFLEDVRKAPDRQLHMATEFELGSESLQLNELRRSFSNMYVILDRLRHQDLQPAMEWARQHGDKLQARGSHLEYELAQLQFVHLFTGGQFLTSSDSEPPKLNPQELAECRAQALEYSRQYFGHFQQRYLDEIARLAGALAFHTNLQASPYRHIFNNADIWARLQRAFVIEFCAVLEISADSPLLLAVTAGAISLPTLLKLQTIMKDKHAEWTTAQELPVEISLPAAFRFHSIFVCPVSKEQTTDDNPPMMMPCGHVIALETLARMSKGSRFKCPYCPQESRPDDARKLVM